jgi:DNA mismatch repair protein MutS2
MDTDSPMLAHALRVLEFEAIRDRVVELASCTLGQERAWEMAPSAREDEVRRLQRETTEAVRLFNSGGGPPFGGIHDIRPAIRAASVEGVLEPHVLLQVADTMAGGRKLKAYLLQREEAAPTLAELARRIGEFPLVEGAIYDAISDQAEVRDDASPALARLRKEIRVVRARMMDRLHSILRGPAYRDMIQDPVITTRDGRYCIPVKSEYRVQFGGLVHDQSSSGATVFMEPTAVVELGNELRQVEIRERQEVERILRELTGRIGRVAEDLAESVAQLGELDFIGARAKLSLAMDAIEPEINGDGFVGLRRARHPLLAGHVVPIDMELGRGHTVVVITGPNTGGKTVSLKTVGLLALMAQSGLHIPAREGSTLPVFRGVYADIGDEQSIQQSLSTFSGHITNIAGILREVDRTRARSLVLLDEVGAGTDPTEGAALAKAILHSLLQSGARTIATTHYGELKEFAYSTEGVENASVEFDMETLQPTYRLMIGIPGTSNAFAIAARLGLPEPVVQAARGMIGTDRTVLSEVIQRLTEDQRATELDLHKAAKAAREVEEKRERYDRELRRLEVDRREILARARSEAEEMIRSARREMDRMREELRRLEKDARKVSQEGASTPPLQTMRDRLRQLSGQLEQRAESMSGSAASRAPAPETPAEPAPQMDTKPPAVGDLVWVSGLNQRGTVLALPEGGKAQVQIGSMRMAVPRENVQRILTPASGQTAPAAIRGGQAPVRGAGGGQPAADLRMRARAEISPEVRLMGLRAEEALTRLDDYMDDVCLAGLSPVRIVHGKGTGALKRVVWEYLQEHPNVAGFRHPKEEEGGSGVTLVELRE